MLLELRIENLLLIERAELSLGRGMNVITGETGAGKTMLAHAIDLLLGGRSKRGIVRPGAAEAYVEGLFELPEGLLDAPEFADLRERLADPDASEIAVGRRVTPEGRTRAYIEGRSSTAADLQLLGGALVAFYGQHEHRKLTLAGAQLAVLDAFALGSAGHQHGERLAELSALHAEASELTGTLAELELLAGRRERELGLIEFELAEIEELAPEVAEEADLSAERDRLRSVDELRLAGEGALAALEDEDAGVPGGTGASSLLAGAVTQLQGSSGADPQLASLADRAAAVALELQDVAADLRAYCAGLAADPERLAQLDDRLDGYERLKRKHGGSIELVLQHAERCREDRDRLSDAGEQIEGFTGRLANLRARQQTLSSEVSKARRKAAPKLAAAVRERLSLLALEGASFEIEISPVAGDIRPTGADVVEFMIAPNPGIAAAPLRETASGGELSRVMLALLTAGNPPADQTFVFDEIDAGIGGHTARAVGEQLRALGQERQVICITHLPQVAAAAESHFRIEKSAGEGAARTEVLRLSDKEVVNELCRMLGADADDSGARKHARELLAAA
ncbi:MAG: DNA repair protein RecN [Thermoleophilaceae bacterium]|nr:DNA repair protein RecN [Thermoleophilaceae bacterium]